MKTGLFYHLVTDKFEAGNLLIGSLSWQPSDRRRVGEVGGKERPKTQAGGIRTLGSGTGRTGVGGWDGQSA